MKTKVLFFSCKLEFVRYFLANFNCIYVKGDSSWFINLKPNLVLMIGDESSKI